MPHRFSIRAALYAAVFFPPAASLLPRASHCQALSPREAQTRGWIAAHQEEAIQLLARVVNISSGTLNVGGVRAVGAVFQSELDALGFTTRWVELPTVMRRAGHLVAEWRGPRFAATGKRLLLIGHLDTVFEGESRRFARHDSVGRGAGTADMKGGDIALLYALKALHQSGALDQLQVIVILTGDEESPGRPLDIARKDLVLAARRSDVALAFEGGSKSTATIARRGSSSWLLTVRGRQAHSSGIFRDTAGYGAIFEVARILDEFRRTLAKQPYLTFSPGAIVGGTDVSFDTVRVGGTAEGKTNIIARQVYVQGDLRFLTEDQKDSTRATMRHIVANHLPATSGEITFTDSYPAMPPTDGGRAILKAFDEVSQALGYGPVDPLPPERRGAGDLSFVSGIVPGLDGLGVDGFGAHSPEEGVYLPSLRMAIERAAVLMLRLGTGSVRDKTDGTK